MSLLKYILKEQSSSVETWYHGTYTKDSFDYDQDKALFVTRDKEIAKHYSGDGDGFFDSGNTNGAIYELKVRTGYSRYQLSAEDYFGYGLGVPNDEWKQRWEEYGIDDFTDDDLDFEGINETLIDEAKKKNKDVLFIEGDVDATPVRDLDYDQMAIINHSIIESITLT